MKNTDLTGKYNVKVTFSGKPWNDPTVSTVILRVALSLEHTRKQTFWYRTLAYKSCIKGTFLVKSQISEKYRQIVLTPWGDILHASRTSNLPHNAKSQVLGGPANVRNIPLYHIIFLLLEESAAEAAAFKLQNATPCLGPKTPANWQHAESTWLQVEVMRFFFRYSDKCSSDISDPSLRTW